LTTASQPVDGGVVLSYEIGTFETTAGTIAEGAAAVGEDADADADADDVAETDEVCCVMSF
jgi:hypothetical protein